MSTRPAEQVAEFVTHHACYGWVPPAPEEAEGVRVNAAARFQGDCKAGAYVIISLTALHLRCPCVY